MPRNPTLHPKLLRRGMQTHFTINKQFWASVRAAGQIIALILIALLLWNTSTLSASVYEEYKQRNEAEQVIISCLRHGAAYFNNELHLCRPANVWIEKGKDLK